MSETIYETGEYLANNPDWHEADAPQKAKWIADFLTKQSVRPQHIEDIGSGSGEILVNLAAYFPDAKLDGWDVSPDAHAIASVKARPGLDFHLGEWKPGTADLVMAIDVFEHVEDYFGFIRRMAQAHSLKLFHIPLDLSAQGVLRGVGLMHARRTIGHLHYFTKETAIATLEDCGLKVRAWAFTHGAERLPNRTLRTRMFNLPRRLVRAVSEDFSVRAMGGASMLVLAQ